MESIFVALAFIPFLTQVGGTARMDARVGVAVEHSLAVTVGSPGGATGVHGFADIPVVGVWAVRVNVVGGAHGSVDDLSGYYGWTVGPRVRFPIAEGVFAVNTGAEIGASTYSRGVFEGGVRLGWGVGGELRVSSGSWLVVGSTVEAVTYDLQPGYLSGASPVTMVRVRIGYAHTW